MALTEEMVCFVADQVLGKRKFTYQGNEIDLTPPWKRIELSQALREATGIDLAGCPTAKALSAALRKAGRQPAPGATRGKLIDGMIGDFLEPKLIQPTFLYNYPREISPLAKSLPADPNTVERFEGFVGGYELCNAFTELNDPLDQESRFLEMGRAYAADDEERHPVDEDYLRAMRYGMPPNGGFGMGIDRLVMLLTDRHSIREVLLFPHLRESGGE
jgi:lysyl-tRNA synthetase class 2